MGILLSPSSSPLLSLLAFVLVLTIGSLASVLALASLTRLPSSSSWMLNCSREREGGRVLRGGRSEDGGDGVVLKLSVRWWWWWWL